MSEVFRLMTRILIRVLIVMTIAAWGASQIFHINLVANQGGHEVCIGAERSGITMQYHSKHGSPPGMRIYFNESVAARRPVQKNNQQIMLNMAGVLVAKSPTTGLAIRLSYLTTVVGLAILYALMRRRRRPVASGSLKSRLKAAASQK